MSPGTLIRSTRERHGLTQAQLALRAGTSQNAVSRLERDEISPSMDTIERLLAAMGERLELSVRRIDGDFDPDHLADSMAQTMTERLDMEIPVIYTSRKGKVAHCEREGVKIDIWIDDSPHWLVGDAA